MIPQDKASIKLFQIREVLWQGREMNMEQETLKNAGRIYEQVQSGEYYQKARQWYDDKYHNPMIERSFFIIVTVLCALTILISVMVWRSMFPLAPVIPYMVTSSDINKELPIIQRLRTHSDQTIDEAIAEFLLKNYVLSWESYQYDLQKIESRFARIRATSEDTIFAEYQALMNPENRSSPLNYLAREGSRKVYIDGVQIPQLAKDGSISNGTVYFSTITNQGGKETQQAWKADITFRFPPLRVDQETNEVWQLDLSDQAFKKADKELYFRVSDYDATERLPETE
jgi:type IV secretory pathway component VirB8